MLIYRSDKDERPAREVWQDVLGAAAALGRSADHDAVVGFLITLAEAESAIADALFSERDGVHPLADALRRSTVIAGHMLLASARSDQAHVERHAVALRNALSGIAVDALPDTLAMPVSEGYAYYALHPEGYADAARQLVRDRQPSAAIVIGVRSIGTSLSAVVAATLESAGLRTETYTVRPGGHPYDRSVQLDRTLVAILSGHVGRSVFVVADEGPGLSGSSFAAVARALIGLGVPAEDIVFLPSWDADGSTFKSDAAREVWRRHRRYCGETVAEAHGAPFHWRPRLYASEDQWPASQPQHERLKWLRGPDIVRFAGLGHYGTARRERAEALAGHGLGPAPVELRNGYLTLPYVEGRPCTAADADRALLEAIATHVATLTRLFPRRRRPDIDTLQRMIETNVRLAVGDGWAAALALAAEERRVLEDAPAAAIDGRMLTHEWLRTAAGFVKVDALDHHADHFFPGTQDAGWDLASAAIEFDVPATARDALLARYVRLSGDRDVRRRLPFYERAYLAFRLGYAAMARDALAGTAESSRFDELVHRYRARLERVLTK